MYNKNIRLYGVLLKGCYYIRRLKMSDSYVELIVKRKTPAIDQVKKILLIGLTVLSVLVGLVYQLFLVLAVILGIACYFLLPMLNLEYEYILVNGELDIDKIMSRSRRKRARSFDLNKMEIMAPLNSHQLDSYNNNRNLKTEDFSSRDTSHKMYCMVIATEKDSLRVIFEPDTEMLNIMKKNAPRKVFID